MGGSQNLAEEHHEESPPISEPWDTGLTFSVTLKPLTTLPELLGPMVFPVPGEEVGYVAYPEEPEEIPAKTVTLLNSHEWEPDTPYPAPEPNTPVDILSYNPTAAAIAVVVYKEGIPHLLCVRRASEPRAGYLSLPGGKIEIRQPPNSQESTYYDIGEATITETPEEAAIRECEEETFLSLPSDILSHARLYGYYYDNRPEPSHRVLIFLITIREPSKELLSYNPQHGDKISECKWIDLTQDRLWMISEKITPHLSHLLHKALLP